MSTDTHTHARYGLISNIYQCYIKPILVLLEYTYVHVTSSYAHVTSSFHIHRDVDFATLSEEEQKARYMQAGVLKVCLNPKP